MQTGAAQLVNEGRERERGERGRLLLLLHKSLGQAFCSNETSISCLPAQHIGQFRELAKSGQQFPEASYASRQETFIYVLVMRRAIVG